MVSLTNNQMNKIKTRLLVEAVKTWSVAQHGATVVFCFEV